MKSLFLFLIITSASMACNTDLNKTSGTNDSLKGKNTESERSKEERNKEIVRASTEAYDRHDVEAVARDFSPDVLDYFPDVSRPVRGVDSFKYNRYQFFKAFPDMHGENLHYGSDGDWVVVWGEWSATWKGDFTGQKATGKSFRVLLADMFKFNEAGKIIEHRGPQSVYDIASQIGMKMPDP